MLLAPATLPMRLWTLDARVEDAAVLTDRAGLREILVDAAELGGASVVGEEFCAFPNGAVTGVLVLAQSHLSIHTWPEYALANVDLLSCGDVRGELVVRTIGRRLGAVETTVTWVPRGPGEREGRPDHDRARSRRRRPPRRGRGRRPGPGS